jgi:hypothetical protein
MGCPALEVASLVNLGISLSESLQATYHVIPRTPLYQTCFTVATYSQVKNKIIIQASTKGEKDL